MPYGIDPGIVAAILALAAGLLAVARWRRAPRSTSSRPAARPPQHTPGKRVLDIDALRTWLAANSADCVLAEIGDRPPVDGMSSRLGGPAWLANGEAWPTGRNGRPMVFVAQINFADVPAMPDYPRTGMLQMFVADSDTSGLHFGDVKTPADLFRNLRRSDHKVIWRPVPSSGGLVRPPKTPESTPFDPQAGQEGRALGFRPVRMHPELGSGALERAFPGLWQTCNWSEVEALMEEQVAAVQSVYIGGYPRFTQDDPREGAEGAAYDRVLLQVGYVPDVIMWGDAGEATWLIRRKDLLKRDFSGVLFSWDCT